MFGSAIGAANLSTLPDTELLRLATRARIAGGEHTGLLAQAALVRGEGVADGPTPDGAIWSLAAALPDGASPAPLVLGLAGPSKRIEPEIEALRRLMRTSIAAAGLTDTLRR